ncbi:MAG TPA: hypothetical protein VGE37_01710, partial [Archangium sp.]
REEREREERKIRTTRVMGAAILTGTVLLFSWLWYRSQSDPAGALISYLPDPIEREIAPNLAPAPTVSSPKTTNPKLADFDKLHPDKAFNPNPTPPAPAPKPKPSADCFDPPETGKLGYLTVAAMTSVRVDVDGKRVCVNATKLPLTVGSHKVKVTEVKTRQEDVSTIRIEAGKVVKLTPVFPKR